MCYSFVTMSIRDGIVAYYQNFGLKGLAAITSYRLIGWPKELTVRPVSVQHPVHLRVRTTDPGTYSEILLHDEYAIDLPFEPQTILDAGANIGMASIYFANRYPDARIVAVEAEQDNYQWLLRNVEPYKNIKAVHAALWNCDGEIGVFLPDAGTGSSGNWSFVVGNGFHDKKVRAVTIATLMQEMNISSFDLVKIDIEGAECEIFENTEWLAGTKCLMIELHDRFRPGCRDAVTASMQEFISTERGETTIYIRPPYIKSPLGQEARS